MQRRLCANCGERTPFFRVRGGPVKLDNKHSLCMACYRDQTNSMKAKKMTNRVQEEMLIWSERHSAFKKIFTENKCVIQGTDLPDPEDPSDPSFIAKIYITSKGAGTETIYGDKIVATDIPALNVFEWSKENISYLKHWLFKVFDDPQIYRGDKIVIEARGNWKDSLNNKL